MAQKMSEGESRRFLMSEPAHTGKIATIRTDGRPHIAPIWFTIEGDELIFTTWHDTVKAANLENNRHVALCVDDERPPFAYVIVEGLAQVIKEAPDLRYWATRIAGRYMGQEQADAFGKRNAVPGEWLVRVLITNIIGEKKIAD